VTQWGQRRRSARDAGGQGPTGPRRGPGARPLYRRTRLYRRDRDRRRPRRGPVHAPDGVVFAGIRVDDGDRRSRRGRGARLGPRGPDRAVRPHARDGSYDGRERPRHLGGETSPDADGGVAEVRAAIADKARVSTQRAAIDDALLDAGLDPEQVVALKRSDVVDTSPARRRTSRLTGSPSSSTPTRSTTT